MPAKNDVFFSAGSCKKDIIFDEHLFSVLLISLGFYCESYGYLEDIKSYSSFELFVFFSWYFCSNDPGKDISLSFIFIKIFKMFSWLNFPAHLQFYGIQIPT